MFFEFRISTLLQLGRNNLSQIWRPKSKQEKKLQPLMSPLLVAGLVIVVGGTAITSYCVVRNLILGNLKEKAVSEVQRASHEIDEWMASLLSQVETLANDSAVRSMDWSVAEPFLKLKVEQLPDYHMFSLVNPDGSYSTTKTGFVRGENLSDRIYFQQAIAGKANISDVLISRSTGVKQINIAAPILSSPPIHPTQRQVNPFSIRANSLTALKLPTPPSHQAKAIGVLAGQVPVNYLTEVISNISTEKGSYAFVLDAKGVPIAHPNRRHIQASQSVLTDANPSLASLARAMVNHQQAVQPMQLEGQWVYVAYTPIKQANWSLALVIPKANLEAQLTALNLLAAVVGTLLILATIITLRQLQLFEQAKVRAAEEALLYRTSARIRASLNLETILQTTVDEVANLLHLDRVTFSWYRSEQEMLEVVCEYRRQDLPSQVGYFDIETFGEVGTDFSRCEIVRVDDSFNRPGITKTVGEIGSYVALPVLVKGSERGYLTCIRTQPWNWSGREIELLGAVTDQLAIAINQSRLLAATKAQVKIASEQAKQLTQALTELKKAQAQLVQCEKMSGLGQLVAGIAHEINNPVNFIHGNLVYAKQYTQDLIKLLQLYAKYYPNPVPDIQDQAKAIDLDFLLEDCPKILSSMQIGTNRIRQIVLSLRNFSHLDEAEMKWVDIHEGIDSTLLILQHRLSSQTGKAEILVIKDYGNLPVIECYARQLNQVFMNLLNNAIDAVEAVMIDSKENYHYPCPTIRICTEIIGENRVAIRIIDNGKGMTKDVKKRLFDPFFTTKPVGQGTGLGLSISYQIVERHGGILKCSSESGQGAEFQIEIPMRQTATPMISCPVV
jgi:two-component system, NtrC family, sensor kinase